MHVRLTGIIYYYYYYFNSTKANQLKTEAELQAKKRNLGVEGMVVVSAASRREEDAGDRLSPSWRSVLRSRRPAGRQPDDVVESTGWVLLSMDEDGDLPPPPPPRLHSAMPRACWCAYTVWLLIPQHLLVSGGVETERGPGRG